jgi:hypothetical protein
MDLEPTLKRRDRTVKAIAYALLFTLLALIVGYMSTPVCTRIPKADVRAFETVKTLEERAASGEPFRKKKGHWYQCKSRLARAMFF